MAFNLAFFQPIKADADNQLNQSRRKVETCNRSEARENASKSHFILWLAKNVGRDF